MDISCFAYGIPHHWTTVSDTPTSPAADHNAIELMRTWHIDLRRACSAWRSTAHGNLPSAETAQGAYPICRLIKLQCAAKAAILFPALRKLNRIADMVSQLETENSALLLLAARLEASDALDAEFSSVANVLCDNFGLHARKMESRLFPCMTRSALDLENLGRTLYDEYLLLSEDDDPVGA